MSEELAKETESEYSRRIKEEDKERIIENGRGKAEHRG